MLKNSISVFVLIVLLEVQDEQRKECFSVLRQDADLSNGVRRLLGPVRCAHHTWPHLDACTGALCVTFK